MENDYLDGGINPPQQNSGLSSLDKEYLMEAAKWARFLGIVGFVFTGFIVLAAIAMMSMGSTFSSLMNNGTTGLRSSAFAGLGAGVGIVYLLIAVLYYFISLYIYNFGKKTKAGILNNEPETLTVGLENLKSHFKLIGILTAVFLAIYAVIIVFGLLFAGFAATR